MRLTLHEALMGERRNMYKILAEKLKGRDKSEMHRREDNTRMNAREIG
jgi:hypothetical protein